jgi:hypothetical protein
MVKKDSGSTSSLGQPICPTKLFAAGVMSNYNVVDLSADERRCSYVWNKTIKFNKQYPPPFECALDVCWQAVTASPVYGAVTSDHSWLFFSAWFPLLKR